MNENLRALQKQHVNGEKCMVATKVSMESQTSVSKRAPWEFRNWRVQENPPTLRQRFANPLPTLRQPFASLSPTLCQPFLPTPLQPPLSVEPSHWFRDLLSLANLHAHKTRKNDPESPHESLRAARVQNETAPKNF